MKTFSQYFRLNKSQYELDFVDVPINSGDIPLFIDPYAISKRKDYWSVDCHNAIVNFFQDVIDLIRSNNKGSAIYMLSGLREPNDIRFGLSTGRHPRGRGVGGVQKIELYNALAQSTAIKTGFITDLEECELLIEGIGRDKISDIATNIIRYKLIEYTKTQCELWNINTNNVSSGLVWDASNKEWINYHTILPVCNNRRVLLVPKAIARFDIEFKHQEYYQHFVLNFLQSAYLNANSSLVHTLRDGTKRPPFKKELKELYPLSKKYLYEFSKEHPEVLKDYKKSKDVQKLSEISIKDLILYLSERSIEPTTNFDSIAQELDTISSGDENARRYHNLITGALTAIFYPYLINPKKELEIHEGRKRIDIVFENAAREGFFFTLPTLKGVPCGYIFIECKNYSNDLSNPELDQLSGRFSVNRGKFGFLVCRNFMDKKKFYKRCKDTAQDDRGFIIPLDDSDIKQLLNLRKSDDVSGINSFLDDCYRKLVM